MNLRDAFRQIGTQLDLDPGLLQSYANEDDLGGWHPDDAKRRWNVGSMFEVEARFIYALVRALRPERILEIGVGNGCTTVHVLKALTLNKGGQLTSVDPAPYTLENIPRAYVGLWTFAPEDGVAWLAGHQHLHFNMVIEDAMHSYEMTYGILSQLAALHPRLVMSHDSEHGVEGERIRAAWTDVYGTFDSVLIEPSDCGLAWKVLR